MKKYKVQISRDDYGYIIIEAKTPEEARELVETGEWTDEMYHVKNGGVSVERVEELEDIKQ